MRRTFFGEHFFFGGGRAHKSKMAFQPHSIELWYAFHNSYYEPVTTARMSALITFFPTLVRDMEIKTVLELGAGIDVFSQYLIQQNLQVEIHDGRAEIVTAIRERFIGLPVYCANLNHLFVTGKHYDLLFAYGILYHLHDPKAFIQSCDKMADPRKGVILLDFMTNRQADESFVAETEVDSITQALDTQGFRPSWRYVVRLFITKFPWIYKLPIPPHVEYMTGYPDSAERMQLLVSRCVLPASVGLERVD